MRFKKLVAGMVACLAVAVVLAGVAQAAWLIEGKELGAAVQEDVKFEAMTPFTLTGNPAGAVKITAKQLECTAGATCSIDGANFGTDHSTAQLTFTEVTVDEPANCSVVGGAITTTALTDRVIMDPKGGLSTFDEFFPEVAPKIAEIEFEGALCPIAGIAVPLKGTITAEMQRTGTAIATQALDFGAAEQATGGGALTWGNQRRRSPVKPQSHSVAATKARFSRLPNSPTGPGRATTPKRQFRGRRPAAPAPCHTGAGFAGRRLEARRADSGRSSRAAPGVELKG